MRTALLLAGCAAIAAGAVAGCSDPGIATVADHAAPPAHVAEPGHAAGPDPIAAVAQAAAPAQVAMPDHVVPPDQVAPPAHVVPSDQVVLAPRAAAAAEAATSDQVVPPDQVAAPGLVVLAPQAAASAQVARPAHVVASDQVAAPDHVVPATQDTAPAHGAGAAPAAARAKARPATKTIDDSFAKVALDDHDLGEIRGGLSVGSGLVVNFAFQEATYVNHSLTQNIVVPTLTVAPGSGAGMAGGVSSFSPGSVAAIGNSQLPVNTPALAVQSLVNGGMTSIVSSIGGGGVANVISNTASNQLVQQVITANIGVTGLAQTIQQSVAATVLSRVQAANSQFR